MEAYKVRQRELNYCLLHFVAFFHVASLFVREVENRKVGVDNRKVKQTTEIGGVDNKKALELTNRIISY